MGLILEFNQEADERIVALRRELRNHPKLKARIEEAKRAAEVKTSLIFTGQEGDKDIPLIETFDQWLGFLAAEVGVLLHGSYSYADICEICDRIRKKLEERRVQVINSPKPTDPEVIS